MNYDSHDLIDLFNQAFGKHDLIIEAPGRINLIGEHTDYNEGFVLPAAIDKTVKIIIRRNNSNTSTLVAFDLKTEFSFNVQEVLEPVAEQWVNYFLGVLHELKIRDKPIGSFDLIFTSSIPIGAGMSSSAAIECGFGYALNTLFNLGLTNKELAIIAQQAEHKFAKVQCGIMDQFASLMGKKDQVMLLDCRSLEVKYYPAVFADYRLVLFDTQAKHNLADSEYNIRRRQCLEGLTEIQKNNAQVKSLRDVKMADLEIAKNSMSPVVYHRCRYVVEENIRVLAFTKALVDQDIDTLGKLMYATHSGLSNLYEVSCKELDLLIVLAKKEQAIAGARMMGGGFGGCTLNLIESSEVDRVKAEIGQVYLRETEIEMKTYQVSLTDGVRTIENIT